MIQPTVGRVVLFHPFGKQDRTYPALVCFVHSDRMINLGGFDQDGVPFSACSVQLLQDGDTLPDVTAYAEWMPYQKGQAAKTEALEQKLAEKA